ncbi:MAG: AAA family ATPase [Deltaproteobacteria bacterium]|nr:AAA family ATPase [Deltaproteobacteria bacterium]
MARTGISGLPPNRPVETALTYLPGISRSRAKSLLADARIDPDLSTDELSELQVDLLRNLIRAELGGPAETSAPVPDRPWLAGAGADLQPYLDRVRAMLQRYLVVLRPWDRSTDDAARNPLPAGAAQTLDTTCMRCLRGEALDPEKVAFVDRMEARLAVRYDDLTPASEAAQRFDELRVVFGLNDLECDLLWLLLAPEIAPEFLWLYRALWRDTARVAWPEDFLQHAADPFAVRGKAVLAALAATATLVRYGLVTASGELATGLRYRAGAFVPGHLLGLPIRLDDVRGLLYHPHGEDDQSERSATPMAPSLREALTRGFRSGRRFLVLGPERAGALGIAREALDTFGEGLLEVRLDVLLANGNLEQVGQVLGRARLVRAGVFFSEVQAMDAGDHGTERLAALVQLLQPETTTMFFHARASRRTEEQKLSPRAHLALLRELGCLELPTAPPSIDERRDLWRQRLTGKMADRDVDDTVQTVSVFKFGVDEIDLTINLAQAVSRQRGMSAVVHLSDVERAVRDVASSRLSGLATRINVRGRWENTILPDDTRETLREMVRFGKHAGFVLDEQGYGRTMGYGRALTAMFSGPSGTGKTLCAGLVARDLGLELFRVDLASVVSKYIGETEERLSKLFDASQDAGIALLFDEADSLFAKRTDVQSSVDRYANLEVNYLLQRLEDFDGVVILTTNNPESIDNAFLRRIRFKPSFPAPELPERERLWSVMIPADAPRELDLKFKDLAADYELTGGQIQNAVIRAAVWAAEETKPISYVHLARAAEREYKDAGRVVRQYADDPAS